MALFTNHWEDIAAIDRHIKGAPLNTSEAAKIRDEWTKFFDGFSWTYANVEDYDRARNLRNRFNLANAVTAAEKKQVEHVMTSGLTTEELAGGTSRRLTSGMYDVPFLTQETRTMLYLGGVAVAGAFLLHHTSKILSALRP